MNNSKKSNKTIDLSSSPPPPTKLKIITNGNGISTAIPANGKFRNRSSKNVLPAAETLDVYEFVSCFSHPKIMTENLNKINFLLAAEWIKIK